MMTNILSKPDFKDWLSPMLVKELRQGTRSRIFMAAFFLTQVLMILSTILDLTSSANGDTNGMTAMLNGVFWFMISVPVLLLTPIRGFASLHGEIKERTLELVFLTRLSAWRIAAGKWTALMVQALLLICGVLPYVLLRYFLGGVDILGDLQSLFFLLIGCGILTGFTVALSPYESKLLRGLLVIGMFFGFIMLLFWFIALATEGASAGLMGSAAALFYLATALIVPAVIVLLLEIGAARIAPAAENHAIRKRLIGIYFLLAGAGLILGGADAEAVIPCVLALLAIVVIDALGENQEFNRTIYRPFLKRGAVGRCLGLFFTPGWASASWYVLLLAVIGGAGIALADSPGNQLLRISFLGALIFPAALIRFFAPRTQHFLGFYIAIQFFCVVIYMLFLLISSVGNQPIWGGLCLFPTCVYFFSQLDKIPPNQMGSFTIATMGITILAIAILIGRSLAPLRDIRTALRQHTNADA